MVVPARFWGSFLPFELLELAFLIFLNSCIDVYSCSLHIYINYFLLHRSTSCISIAVVFSLHCFCHFASFFAVFYFESCCPKTVTYYIPCRWNFPQLICVNILSQQNPPHSSGNADTVTSRPPRLRTITTSKLPVRLIATERVPTNGKVRRTATYHSDSFTPLIRYVCVRDVFILLFSLLSYFAFFLFFLFVGSFLLPFPPLKLGLLWGLSCWSFTPKDASTLQHDHILYPNSVLHIYMPLIPSSSLFSAIACTRRVSASNKLRLVNTRRSRKYQQLI